jgi:hypothetical protein
MRQFLAGISSCAAALVVALLAVLMVVSSSVHSDASESDAPDPAAPATPACGSDELVVYQSNLSAASESGCGATARTLAEIAEARAYLIETASPGYTMTLQGPELAIGRLHPEFVVRLESAIRQARSAGLPFAGVFSAYRPPAFGIGGFADKFNSLHTYGLAVDMRGIGKPGSPEAQLWHQIAAKNGVVCPYGPRDLAEWNHCQPTRVKIILAENPLRDTVSAVGPFDLESMFEAGNRLIEGMASAADYLFTAPKSPATSEPVSLNGHGAVTQPAPIMAAPAVPSQVWKAQKTVRACQKEWRAIRAANQRTTTEKAYVAECQAGGAAAQPPPTTTASAMSFPGLAQKIVNVCQEEWRAIRAANQRTTTQKIYVAHCRAARHSYVDGGYRFTREHSYSLPPR